MKLTKKEALGSGVFVAQCEEEKPHILNIETTQIIPVNFMK